jgi:hypothetical protein
MAAKLWEGSYPTYRESNDQPASGATAYFYAAETSTVLTVYQDGALTIPHAWPVVASARGQFPAIYMPFSDFRVRVVDQYGVSIIDFDDIENTDPASGGGGGGGGGDVGADEIFQTGDTKFLEKDGALTGWVRDNARTIGNAASGATERANADCADLYAFYWDTFSDAICPVTGGRGATAASDFAAGKPIATLDKRGRVPVGSDTMGNSAANRIQVSTTVSTTDTSTSAIVASATGLIVGQFVVSANIPAGTTITAISGLTITLSLAATATASGTAARFSFFTDAQTPGASGGVQSHTNTTAETPAHSHTGNTDPAGSHNHSGVSDALNDHSHGYLDNTATGSAGAQSGASFTAMTSPGDSSRGTSGAGAHQHNLIIALASDHNHAFTSGQTGGGRPHNNLQPGIIGTWYRKLVWLGGLPLISEIALRIMSGGA